MKDEEGLQDPCKSYLTGKKSYVKVSKGELQTIIITIT